MPLTDSVGGLRTETGCQRRVGNLDYQLLALATGVILNSIHRQRRLYGTWLLVGTAPQSINFFDDSGPKLHTLSF
jgi:hypothetical protein